MSKSTLTMFVTGDAPYDIEVTADTTLAEVAQAKGLTSYDFIVDNVVIDRSKWDATSLLGVKDIWASKGVKGA